MFTLVYCISMSESFCIFIIFQSQSTFVPVGLMQLNLQDLFVVQSCLLCKRPLMREGCKIYFLLDRKIRIQQGFFQILKNGYKREKAFRRECARVGTACFLLQLVQCLASLDFILTHFGFYCNINWSLTVSCCCYYTTEQ